MRCRGFIIKIAIDFTWWEWVPNFGVKYSRGFHWLCFHSWVSWNYRHRKIHSPASGGEGMEKR